MVYIPQQNRGPLPGNFQRPTITPEMEAAMTARKQELINNPQPQRPRPEFGPITQGQQQGGYTDEWGQYWDGQMHQAVVGNSFTTEDGIFVWQPYPGSPWKAKDSQGNMVDPRPLIRSQRPGLPGIPKPLPNFPGRPGLPKPGFPPQPLPVRPDPGPKPISPITPGLPRPGFPRPGFPRPIQRPGLPSPTPFKPTPQFGQQGLTGRLSNLQRNETPSLFNQKKRGVGFNI